MAKVSNRSGFDIIKREDGAAFLPSAPSFVVVEVGGDTPGAAVPEVEGETNGDEPVVKLRGAYTEGTATMMLSRSKKIMRSYINLGLR